MVRAFCLAVLCLLAAAAPATASVRIQRATFAVEVKGTQTTMWTVDYDDPFRNCGAYHKGSGSERMSFETRRPVRATVTSLNGYLSFRFGRTSSFLARAVANRQGTLTSTPHPEPCADGGEGGAPPPAPPPPDCGRKVGSVDLTVQPSYRRRSRIMLGDGGLTPLVQYRRCPISGVGFPDLLTSTTSGGPIEADMPARDLFNRRLRKHITLGRGTQTQRSPGRYSQTRVSWEITLTRLR